MLMRRSMYQSTIFQHLARLRAREVDELDPERLAGGECDGGFDFQGVPRVCAAA
jgi:hypothetical protein